MSEIKFKDIMKQRRMERGMTLDELASMTDISVSYLSRLEKGERVAPSQPIVNSIYKALGMGLELVKDEDITAKTKYQELEELINMYAKKGDINIRETIEIMEMIEGIIKRKEG